MNASNIRTSIHGLGIAAAILLVLSSGCAEFNFRDKLPAMMGKTGEFRRPMRVVAIWSDTVLNTPGQPSIRGFGARLMFYEDKKDKPIKVSGELTVYAFDEAGRAKTDARPDRKYVFTAEQMKKHYSKSELGHSYSVWVPWDPVGGEAKEISLIVRFVPVEGGVVISEQVKQFLPGTKPGQPAAPGPYSPGPFAAGPYAAGNAPQPDPQAAVRVAPVQLVQHQEIVDRQDFGPPPANSASEPPRMSTTTIAIPFRHGGAAPTALMRPRAMRPSPRAPFPGATPEGLAPGGASSASAAPQASQGAANPPQPGFPTAATTQRSGTPPGQSWIAHYAQRRSRALGEPIAQLQRDRGPLRPSPATRPSDPAAGPSPTTIPGLFPSAAPNPR